MSVADEIRARVKQADEARIESRSRGAATVALVHGQRVELLRQLSEVDAELARSVHEAFEVMTLDELVEFSGVPRADVRGKVPPTAVKARSPKTRRRTTQKATSSAAAPPAEPAA